MSKQPARKQSPTPGPINVSVSTIIEAPADVVFDLVTDIERMADWSPQIIESRWISGTIGDGRAAVGAKFLGKNTAGDPASGKKAMTWVTKPTVTDVVANRVFEFSVPFPSRSTWRYELTPVDGGTRVVETLSQTKRMPPFIRFMQKRANITDRAADLESAMHLTLDNIAAAATESVRTSS